MKISKKVQKKLNDRNKGFEALMRGQFSDGRHVKPGQYTRPGSRNRRKS